MATLQPLTTTCDSAQNNSVLTYLPTILLSTAPDSSDRSSPLCGHHGSAQLSSLVNCCGGDSYKIGSIGPYMTTCGFACPSTKSLDEWIQCLKSNSTDAASLDVDKTSPFCIGKSPVALSTPENTPSGAGSRRINTPSAPGRLLWTLFGILVLGMLAPCATALPAELRAGNEPSGLLSSRSAHIGCILGFRHDEYLAYDTGSGQSYTVNVSGAAGQTVTSPFILVKPERIEYTNGNNTNILDNLCAKLYSSSDPRCAETLVGAASENASYSTIVPEGTKNVTFTLTSLYTCAEGQFTCEDGTERIGKFCTSGSTVSDAPFALWNVTFAS
ncbi:hypothetical protein OC846_006074 [Tilletia horrida]|uniref:Hydrophobin n=1 Tax=Tilletia horrida TaxID=155126 RepID=A0AAN6GKK4_9BASI|nr:hypothetical protein OC846_006074 [Tilletia horrida]KAK0560572.1 hypothetical protein OC861_006227 [Tilletia horrida]